MEQAIEDLLAKIEAQRRVHPVGSERPEYAYGYTLFDVYQAAARVAELRKARADD